MADLDKKDSGFFCPLCTDCKYEDENYDDLDGYRCRRLQIQKRNCVNGYDYYEGETLSCHSERRRCLTIKERIFGENKDKCGKRGIYFKKKG